jgi:hypothetical protein
VPVVRPSAGLEFLFPSALPLLGKHRDHERRRNRWNKKLNCGLVFEVSTDLGGSAYCTQMPLMFRIFHADDPEFVFELRGNEPFEQLVYGSRLYGGGGDSSEFVLGVRANIELFDVIAASFSQQA